jgi:hypothetical protein
MFQILAGNSYPLLNTIQCEITFAPANFIVAVTLANGIIVSPTNAASTNIDPDKHLRRPARKLRPLAEYDLAVYVFRRRRVQREHSQSAGAAGGRV